MREYISKQEAIEAFSDMSDGIPITHGDMISDTAAVNVIKSIPFADVRPNIHARWEDRDGISDFMYCSNCGGKKHYSEKWIGCPYCGADMREPKGENNE